MKNRENLDASARCVPAYKFSDLWNQPIDRYGKPYMIGYRICKHFDCIQPKHITQSRFIAKRIYGYLPKLNRGLEVPPMTGPELLKIAKPTDKRNPPKRCQVPECQRPHRGLGLCNAHHNSLYRYRQSIGKQERIKRDNSDIEQYMIPPRGNDLRASERHCHYPNCTEGYFARGLCKTHHKRWLRWKQKNER